MSIVDKNLYLHDEQDLEELFCQFTSLFGFHSTLKFFCGGLITFLLYPGLQYTKRTSSQPHTDRRFAIPNLNLS